MTISLNPRRFASCSHFLGSAWGRPAAIEINGFEPMIMHTSAVAGPWCSAIHTPMRPCAMVLPGWSIEVATHPRGLPSASRNALVNGAVNAFASPNVPLYNATASGPCSSTMRVSDAAISSIARSDGIGANEPSG